eukprot:12419008-Karenia_brevis.AAC.1
MVSTGHHGGNDHQHHTNGKTGDVETLLGISLNRIGGNIQGIRQGIRPETSIADRPAGPRALATTTAVVH